MTDAQDNVPASPAASREAADLKAMRQQIDGLDHQIVKLLNDRARVVVEVGKAKQVDGSAIYRPAREQAVLHRVSELNEGPLSQRTLHAIYREVMSGSFALEKPLRIGFLGPQGSYSHLASMRKFGGSVEHQPLPDFRAIFAEVANGHCDLGVVPIENSLGGGVIDTMDCFVQGGTHICAEVLLEIHHNLLAKCPPEEIRVLTSKPEIFAQCRSWISTSMPGLDLIPAASSSRAAELAASEPNTAAIGSELAAELYGLQIVFANVEDNPNNQTRFFVIGKHRTERSGNDKTSILFTTDHQAGALADVVNIFARNAVNMTYINNRPLKRKNWEYYFFVDFEGHVEDARIRATLDEVKTHCNELHVLGSYPKAHTTV